MGAAARPQRRHWRSSLRRAVGRKGARGGIVLCAAAVALAVTGVVARGENPDPKRPVDAQEASRSAPERTYRPFSADSWWNAPLPDDVPLDPAGKEILDYLRTAPESGAGCLMLAGAGPSHWGHPIYWADSSDPSYDVQGLSEDRPPELANLRIPRNAQPAANNDASMTIYDREKGYVVALTNAEYDARSQTWSATGASITYLDSNGLHADAPGSDDPRNIGTHRGNNGATMAVSWDEVRAGAIRHVLKVAAGPEVANRFVFPMVGSDGDYEGNDPAVPPQGLRFRISPSVDLEALDLQKDALVIARALQRYGFYIGDSGGRTALKLENTRAEGRGQLWHLPADALCTLPFASAYWDVVAEGYDPSDG